MPPPSPPDLPHALPPPPTPLPPFHAFWMRKDPRLQSPWRIRSLLIRFRPDSLQAVPMRPCGACLVIGLVISSFWVPGPSSGAIEAVSLPPCFQLEGLAYITLDYLVFRLDHVSSFELSK